MANIKNNFFYFPLNLLFFIGKLQGLIIFSYDTGPVISYRISTLLSRYSNVYTVVIIIVLQILAKTMLSWFQFFHRISKMVLIVVFIAETVITTFRVIMVYILQILYRKQYRYILCRAVQIHQRLIVLMNGVLIFDKSFYRCYISRIVGVFLQLAIICFISSQYKRFSLGFFYGSLITFSTVTYTHFTTITISCIFYAGMMFILFLYQNLNRKSLQLSNSIQSLQDVDIEIEIKRQLMDNIIVEIDQVVHIYERISTFSRKFNQIFSAQILLATFNAFYVILVQVVKFIITLHEKAL